MRKLIFLCLLICLYLPSQAQEAPETSLEFIALAGAAAEENAEHSSLVWFGDTLLLIAENPQLYAEDGAFGAFFTLEKSAILDYLNSPNATALEPARLPIYTNGLMPALREANALFDGFEAAAIVEGKIYLQIETYTLGLPPMKSFIVSGDITAEGITLDASSLLELPVQTNFPNLSYESLIVQDNNLLALYEANGTEANPDAEAEQIALENGAISTLPMPNIPYRITDASEIDENGNFWVINYYYPSESHLGTENDPISAEFGVARSTELYEGSVERLLELHLGDSRIERVEQPPIYLAMSPASHGRNWEGIVRLDDLGFLLVTDKFPETLFAFVPFEKTPE